jgi:cyclic beta-1,2-glucan synthetase
LLASQARLASFVTIAKDDVPQHHWFHLGRLVTSVGGRATLMSWGGTMFEYLMPQLLLRGYPGTLLDESCRASVRRQVEYGKERRVPWGISESAYAFTDRLGNYQYKAFGVPGLGFKRSLGDDLVVSPYSTALAGLIDPAAACEHTAEPSRPRGRFVLRIHRLSSAKADSRCDTPTATVSRNSCARFSPIIKECRW